MKLYEPETVRSLVENALYMIKRMEDRLREYERLRLILEETLKIGAPENTPD